MRIKYNRYSGFAKLENKLKQTFTRVTLAVSALVAALGIAIIPAASAHGASVVYNNIPNDHPGNVPSLGFEATSTSEFGGQVQLDDSERNDPTVSVLMSSWACKSGTWNDKNCITNPGSTFKHPVTLNVYTANEDNSPGELIASETRTFTMPYRPTADDGTNCNAANNTAGEWWDGETCNNGKAFDISFKLDDVTLPDNVILAVAYNTSDYGVDPLGTDTACHATAEGCPYDSLNVGTNPSPSVGSALPTADDAYLKSSWTGAYCDNGAAGIGTLRLDAGCWTGFLPAFKVTAENGKKHHGHHYGWFKGKHNPHNDLASHKGDRGRDDANRNKPSFFSMWHD